MQGQRRTLERAVREDRPPPAHRARRARRGRPRQRDHPRTGSTSRARGHGEDRRRARRGQGPPAGRAARHRARDVLDGRPERLGDGRGRHRHRARDAARCMGRLPLVVEVAPASRPDRSAVAIKGRGFDPTPAGNRVTIGGAPALVLAASPNELQVAAPAAPTTGSQAQLPVVVEARGASSSGRATFALAHPLSGQRAPALLPRPGRPRALPIGTLFVSTEIGPVLVLTGKGGREPRQPSARTRVAATLTGSSIGRPAARRDPRSAGRGHARRRRRRRPGRRHRDRRTTSRGTRWPGTRGRSPARATPRQIAGLLGRAPAGLRDPVRPGPASRAARPS